MCGLLVIWIPTHTPLYTLTTAHKYIITQERGSSLLLPFNFLTTSFIWLDHSLILYLTYSPSLTTSTQSVAHMVWRDSKEKVARIQKTYLSDINEELDRVRFGSTLQKMCIQHITPLETLKSVYFEATVYCLFTVYNGVGCQLQLYIFGVASLICNKQTMLNIEI